MSTPRRFGRTQKALTLLPLALLSAAWTAGLAAPTVSLTAAADQVDVDLPDGTSVPTEAIEAPASLSRPGAIAPGVPAGRGAEAVRTASTNGIPAAALAAYQRAETVINRADAGCNITWQLVAAIGRVESDHGRFGGNVLDSDGVAQPGIRGIPLDGRNGTATIRDTDAGQLDADRRFDRAVGPMQFIPSTWSVVGVDADGDGERNPQDIDDAALASAVYLCSGDEDLSTTAGQRSAVFRYNNSEDYVDLVLSIMEAYSQGDYSSVPTATASGNTFQPAPEAAPRAGGPAAGAPVGPSGGGAGTGTSGGTDTDVREEPEPSPAPSPDPAPSQPPVQPPSGGGGGNSPGGNNGGGVDIPKDPTGPIKDVLTTAEARVACLADLGLGGILSSLLTPSQQNQLAACITEKTS
ncbi:hypothetical protein GCM10009737_24970 [Nocardioides lentus]|uniref:Transglycosylase SLT domain-containing protein n=1 Tax=Nocardioides lentus TaxID=338077 RepID=A0ABN2PI41_9ACTN